jgi:sporulation protein YlmC with PRC-barrel domain
MHVRLEAQVFSLEGIHVGKVDRIIIDPRTLELAEFIIHKGVFLTHDRIVEPLFVERVADDGNVVLRLTAQEVDHLPEFVHHEYVTPSPAASRDIPYPALEDLSGAGHMQLPIFWRSSYSGHEFATAGRFEFDSAPVAPLGVEIRSNISEDMVVVDEHTAVIACDGKKLGVVDEVLFDEYGDISGFVVRTGLLHIERIRVPVETVKTVTTQRIRLRVTAADVARPEALPSRS